MSRRLVRWFVAAVFAFVGVGAFAQDTVVYHFDDTEAQALKGLRNIRNHLDSDPGAKITVVTHTPSGPGIGGTLVMTIQGNTGTMTNQTPNVFLTPASKSDWPANVFELESMSSTFSYAAAQGGPQTHTNELTFTTGQSVAVDYTVVYTFRIVNLKLTPTTVQPVNYLASGGQMKHTAIDSMPC